jgi:Domain of unknown function (DUF4258)
MGSAAPISKFAMNDVSLRRKIAQIAADSSRVVVLPHAKQRMRKRHILLTQILCCLRRGNMIEPAHQDIKGCWKCTLEALVSGDLIKVAAALDKNESGDIVLVITVMH